MRSPTSLLNQPLQSGAEIILPTIQSPDMEARRHQIAAQLFPKATIAQQEAFKDRIQRQTNYLSAVDSLESLDISTVPVDEAVDQLTHLLKTEGMPLTTSQRERFDQMLDDVMQETDEGAQRDQLDHTLSEILGAVTPIFLNLIRCQYPITASLSNFRNSFMGGSAYLTLNSMWIQYYLRHMRPVTIRGTPPPTVP